MKKLLVLLLTVACALCLVFAVAGCNGNGDAPIEGYIYKCSQTEHWQENSEGEVTAHSPHSIADGVCHTCGYVEKCTEGLEFKEIIENEEIVGYSVSKGTATDNDIYVPSFHNGLPVTTIGRYAFTTYSILHSLDFDLSLESIFIGNGVTAIGVQAFYYCAKLTSITIPQSVTYIGQQAFDHCISLESVYITDIAAWCNIDFDGPHYSLEYAKNLYLKGQPVINLNIPQGVTEIKDYAFRGYTSLESVTIPNSVTSIGVNAFYFCTNLTDITIPDSVTSIGVNAFGGCENLESVTFNNTVGWKVSTSDNMSNAESVDVNNPTQNATYMKSISQYYWKRG